MVPEEPAPEAAARLSAPPVESAAAAANRPKTGAAAADAVLPLLLGAPPPGVTIAAPPREATPAASPAARPPTAGPRTYVVQPGDTLYRIAERLYGDAEEWKRIREANAGRIDADGRVRAGQILQVP
jgi:5'-nucleotidase